MRPHRGTSQVRRLASLRVVFELWLLHDWVRSILRPVLTLSSPCGYRCPQFSAPGVRQRRRSMECRTTFDTETQRSHVACPSGLEAVANAFVSPDIGRLPFGQGPVGARRWPSSMQAAADFNPAGLLDSQMKLKQIAKISQ